MISAISGSPFGVNRTLKSPPFSERMPASSRCSDRSREARRSLVPTEPSLVTGTSTSLCAPRFLMVLRPFPLEGTSPSSGHSSSSRSGLLPTPTVDSCERVWVQMRTPKSASAMTRQGPCAISRAMPDSAVRVGVHPALVLQARTGHRRASITAVWLSPRLLADPTHSQAERPADSAKRALAPRLADISLELVDLQPAFGFLKGTHRRPRRHIAHPLIDGPAHRHLERRRSDLLDRKRQARVEVLGVPGLQRPQTGRAHA